MQCDVVCSCWHIKRSCTATVCCSVLQCVAVWCSVVWCSVTSFVAAGTHFWEVSSIDICVCIGRAPGAQCVWEQPHCNYTATTLQQHTWCMWEPTSVCVPCSSRIIAHARALSLSLSLSRPLSFSSCIAVFASSLWWKFSRVSYIVILHSHFSSKLTFENVVCVAVLLQPHANDNFSKVSLLLNIRDKITVESTNTHKKDSKRAQKIWEVDLPPNLLP